MWRITVAGQRSSGRFAARYDGRKYRVAGMAEMDSVAMHRDGPAVIAVFSKGLQPVYGYRMAVSADRRRLTIRSVNPRTYRVVFSIVEYVRVR